MCATSFWSGSPASGGPHTSRYGQRTENVRKKFWVAGQKVATAAKMVALFVGKRGVAAIFCGAIEAGVVVAMKRGRSS